MGTNYEWRHEICTHCNRYQSTHVGKQSAGWSFFFRAWPHQLENVDHPDWGFHPESPFGFAVLSRADWRTVFTTVPGELWDEYGHFVVDPLSWLAGLVPPTAGQIEAETAMMSRPTWMDPPTDWRDPEGFRIDAREFS